jgi:hypothetical protein
MIAKHAMKRAKLNRGVGPALLINAALRQSTMQRKKSNTLWYHNLNLEDTP